MSEALVLHNGEQPFFSADQEKMIRDSFLNGASESEAAVLLEVARLRRLNPLTRQIHFVKRNQWDDRSKSYREVWSHQIGIDGLRAVAERTGRYDGQDEPEFTYDKDGKLTFCRVRVYKKGIGRPFVGIAHWLEYVQTKKEGQVTKMWAEKPHIMLAKCAEALGLRKGFPEETAGLYIPEEMGRAPDEAAEPTPTPAQASPRKAAVAVVEVDTKALAARRIDADATLTEKLQETVANSQQGPRADGKQVAGDDGSRHMREGPQTVTDARPSAEDRQRDPVGHGSAEGGPPTPAAVATLPPGPSKFEQLLALLDEVRQSGGWKSKARMREWCADYKAHIDPLTESEKDSIRGAIEVCGYRK